MPDVYVDTDVSPGGSGTSGDPYASWDEAWEAEDVRIDGGETWNFFFRGTTADTARVILDGWPHSGTGDVALNFFPWHTEFGAVSDADDGWYQGAENWSTSHYRLEVTNTYPITIDGDGRAGSSINIQGLQVSLVAVVSGQRVIDIAGTPPGSVNLIGNRIKIAGSGTFPRGVRVGTITTDLLLTATNNVIFYAGTADCSSFNINDSQCDANLLNNTVIYSGAGGEDFFDDVAGCTINAYNNVAYAGATTRIEFDSAGTLNSDYNATIVSGDRGANGFDVATGDFTSYGTGDADELTPAASQTNAWGAGGITNGDQALVPLTDIRGNARNTGSGQATAIGAFAASGEGAGGGAVDLAGEGLVGGGAIAAGAVTPSATVAGAALATSGALGTGAVVPTAVLSGLAIVASGSLASPSVSALATISGAALASGGQMGAGTIAAQASLSGVGIVASGQVAEGEVSTSPQLLGAGLVAAGTLGAGPVVPHVALAPLGLSGAGVAALGVVTPSATLSGASLVASGTLAAGAVTTAPSLQGVALAAGGVLGAPAVTPSASLSPIGLQASGILAGGSVTIPVENIAILAVVDALWPVPIEAAATWRAPIEVASLWPAPIEVAATWKDVA